MKKSFGLLVVLFVLSSCVPAAVPAAEPVFYEGSKAEIYAAVVQSVSTSVGLPDSNGWIITQSDAAGGFVRAETSVMVRGFLGIPTDQYKTESVSIVVSENTTGLTQVVIQVTSGGIELGARVKTDLDSKFNRG
jgi:hypothetical protein